MREWVARARCGSSESGIDPKDFQVPLHGTSQNKAKLVCVECPVRLECLQWALEHREIWGVWGGLDEGEIRKALSVDANGRYVQRKRAPGCPNPSCRARASKLEVVKIDRRSGLRCTQCNFEWFSRTSTIAVVRHLKRTQRLRERVMKHKSQKAHEEALAPEPPIPPGDGGLSPLAGLLEALAGESGPCLEDD